MTIDVATMSALVAICVGVLTVLAMIVKTTARLAALEVKVDTLWSFQLRRGLGEAVQKGIATFNSPLVLTQEAKSWMAELAGRVRDFYVRLGRHMTENDLAMEIERLYGQEIMEKVCIPNGISQGACLVIAVAVAREALGSSES